MSEQNVELVQRGLDAWNRRDWEGGLVNTSPDIVWRTSGVIPDLEKVYTGHAGVLEFWRNWAESWDTIQIEPEEMRDLGDHVLVVANFRAGSRGEITVDQPVAFIFRVDQGELVEFQSYWDRDEVWPDVERLERGL